MKHYDHLDTADWATRRAGPPYLGGRRDSRCQHTDQHPAGGTPCPRERQRAAKHGPQNARALLTKRPNNLNLMLYLQEK